MSGMEAAALTSLSQGLAALAAAAAPFTVTVRANGRGAQSGMLWRSGVVVTSEQGLPETGTPVVVLPGGKEVPAQPAGRDPGTNVAVLRVEAEAPSLPEFGMSDVGGLVLLAGADGSGGVTARLGILHLAGPAWHSQAGGRIDRLIRLDATLTGTEEGGPVLTAEGKLVGMSTLGPRRRALAIPAETIARVLGPLLEQGRVARGWLGVGLHPVAVPPTLREAAGQEAGLMVVSLAEGSPAEQAGLLPGDLLLSIDDQKATHLRALAERLGPEHVGRVAALKLMRGGQAIALTVTVGARPRQ